MEGVKRGTMPLRELALIAVLAVAAPLGASEAPAIGPFTASGLAQFLASYDKGLEPIDAAFAQLETDKLPLLDESGHPLGRRTIIDRHRAVADLRDTVRRLAASPQDLVLALTLFSRGEKLMDDLYDLAQIAYDNDEEELGKRFTALLTEADRNQELVEAYALSLAADKEARLRKLEAETREREKKPAGSPEASKGKSSPPQ